MVAIGGLLLSPEQKIEAGFSWKLATTTNNQVGIYALFLGTTLFQLNNVKNITILSDSFFIVNQGKGSLGRDLYTLEHFKEYLETWMHWTMSSFFMFE